MRSQLIFFSLAWLAFLGPAVYGAQSGKRLEVFVAGFFPADEADKRWVIVTDDEFILKIDKATEGPAGSFGWGVNVTEKRLQLKPKRASKLWAEIERLRIFEWRDSYSPEDVGATVHDGMGWSVSIEVAGRSMTSNGTNTYPLMEPFAEPTVDVTKPTAFHRLQQLLRPLEEEASRALQPMPDGRG